MLLPSSRFLSFPVLSGMLSKAHENRFFILQERMETQNFKEEGQVFLKFFVVSQTVMQVAAWGRRRIKSTEQS